MKINAIIMIIKVVKIKIFGSKNLDYMERTFIKCLKMIFPKKWTMLYIIILYIIQLLIVINNLLKEKIKRLVNLMNAFFIIKMKMNILWIWNIQIFITRKISQNMKI